ncbi:MAG: 2-polyprenyl-3-methyl-6-methoxy-1,4-benzoquinone monooxygenase [Gammaproteobacteria bacterium]|nr:2-polyprenyl-3-methyl-6-methoxy-1,4-benzoquinone monooxygenase [Gammaproteobacteria bacterium]
MSNNRSLSALDQALSWVDERLRARFSSNTENSFSDDEQAKVDIDWPENDIELSEQQRKLSARLMRVNHAGEVAAQALYRGQQRLARDPNIANHLRQAADEEQQHLHWCKSRLNELDGSTSVLDPIWFSGAYAIGATSAALGDQWSLGFVVETERQVANHLSKHLQRLPTNDKRSRAILEKMRDDEIHHGSAAESMGGRDLPQVVKIAMNACSKIMTRGAYYL